MPCAGRCSVSRKPRTDCKPLQLSAEDQQKAFAFLKELGYVRGRIKIAEECGQLFSVGALHNAYQHWIAEEADNRILQAVAGADSIIGAAADNLPRIDKAMEAALKQTAFEAVLNKDVPTMQKLVGALMRIQRQELDSRQLDLRTKQYETQIEAAKASLNKAKRDGGMTPEAIAAMEEALGML